MTDNLLVDPIFRVRTNDGIVQASLPGVLELLGRDAVADFPGLRPHQRHPWHAFLCQMAVMTLEEAGFTEWPKEPTEADWRAWLRSLTPEFPDDAPWKLVVSDLAKPAFLQPPVPEGSLASFTGMAESNQASPLDLDVLVTAKEHGEKGKSEPCPLAEDWFFGLLLLQTFSGFLGQGNYGIVRQNGGFAARPGVSLTFSHRPGPNWRRDGQALFGSETWRSDTMFHPECGLRLLWLMPWNGGADEALPLAELHPLFIEVCRRVRLIRGDGGVISFRAKGTKGPRVSAKANNGVLGDPWIPINISATEPKAFNSKPRYSIAYQVMFDQSTFEPCLLQLPHTTDPTGIAMLTFRVFCRTQGGSDGYHERAIPLPPKGQSLLTTRRTDAATVAKAMAVLAKDAQNKVLVPAVLQLLQAARDAPEFKQPETSAWASNCATDLDRTIDDAFFPSLWDCLDAMGENPFEPNHLKRWSEFLTEQVRKEFLRACAALPTSSALHYRAVAKAENFLEGSLRKNLTIKETA